MPEAQLRISLSIGDDSATWVSLVTPRYSGAQGIKLAAGELVVGFNDMISRDAEQIEVALALEALKNA